MCLFQIRHLITIYGVDLRGEFLAHIELPKLEKLAGELLNDREALKYLSSFAVNYLYLLEALYQVPADFEPDIFLELRAGYDVSDPVQLDLLVYLFTHCVIADSNFYTRQLPAGRRTTYHEMIKTLDELIDAHPEVKLDAKLEYLVASRICGLVSPLQERIDSQLQLSDKGAYIIDPAAGSGADINSLNVSEHRNVLYIMSRTPYRPHRVRLS